jgi:acyl carrier protein phosphodiesterase
MNFLAHGYLSRHSDALIVGNFVADFVKGKPGDHYGEEIIKGIIMHRKIDEFTDSHRVFLRSKNRIRDKYRHYTGVIIDLFYDHFLASDWKTYCDESLPSFCQKVYKVIYDHFQLLPEDARKMIPWMTKYNWLLNYSTIDGIDRSLKGLSKRTPFESGMENASLDLRDQYDEFSMDFKEFFPEMIRFVNALDPSGHA